MNKLFKWAVIFILLIVFGFVILFKFSPSFKKSAEIKALDKIGDIAVKRMSENPEAKGSVAAEFINIPIVAREISENIWQATGVANAHLISTREGNVLFDTGLATQVPKQMKALKAVIPGHPLTHIIVSHSHADHAGGTSFGKTRAQKL